MNERHELKMHGHEPEAWPQKTPTPISLWLAYVVGLTETNGLSDMLADLSCSSEPARINGYGGPADGSSSSSNNQAPIYLRANQALVKSKIPFPIHSTRIMIKKQPVGERWMDQIHEV